MDSARLGIRGTIYGVALNDRDQIGVLKDQMQAPPYNAPPQSVVLYIKPRTCLGLDGAPTRMPQGLAQVQAAATLGLLIGRDLSRAAPDQVRSAISAACLALDLSEPCRDFYRPAIRQQCRDGFLPIGSFARLPETLGDIVTEIDGHEVHRWSQARLVRPLESLAAEISSFMTLKAGDLLLVGLASDPPAARIGQTVRVTSNQLPVLSSSFIAEAAS